MLGAKNEDAKERCLEVYKEEKRKVKRCLSQIEKEVYEQFGRKMNQDVNGNRKLFWKKVSKANGGKVKNLHQNWKRWKWEGFGMSILGSL